MFRSPLRYSAVCAATLFGWTLLDSAASAQQEPFIPAVVYTSASGDCHSNCDQCNSGNCQSGSCDSGLCNCGSCDSCGCDQCGGGKGGLWNKCLRACGLGGGGTTIGQHRRGVGEQCLDCESSTTDLFYNYYVPAVCDAQMPAMMYMAPHPTPTVAGRVYYTYQPLLPHEHLYRHCRVYRNHYDCHRGLNRTFVKYQVGPGYAGKNRLKWALYLPR